MKPYLTLLLLVASLSACARESAPVTAPAQAPTAASSAASAAPAAAAPASPTELAAAARTQQEGADTPTASDSSESELERVAALPPQGQLPSGKWVAGTNYKVLMPSQPTDAPPGKVEVIEMFWYACPHCYAIDPYLEGWRKNAPNYIDFVRVPVTWGDDHRARARLFYTLQALGRLDELHPKVFDQIHQQGNMMYAPGNEKATLQAELAFAKNYDISEADFMSAYNSFAVMANLQKADDLVRRYRIEAVPSFVINGKYVTDVGMADSNPTKLLEIINDLAASEKRH